MMKMYNTPQAVEKYLNIELECDCGRTHYAPIKAVNVSKGALASLPGYVKEYGYSHPYMLCDEITYKVAGAKCEEYLSNAGIESAVLILKHLGFDEATLGEIVINKPDDCDLMIGVGTGSITDMTRFSSYKLNLPCFTVATGAPMDGFAASVGIMNVNNMKATMKAHSTEVIIGDTDVLKGAPYRMTIAGFADLVAKINALNDWRLDRVINNGHYCRKIDELVVSYVDDIFTKTEKIKNHDPEAIGDVMNALLLTGSVISLYGTSRPISGAEHHMSHYWEVVGEQQGKQLAMHGEQVSVGTYLALRLCEALREEKIDFDKARRDAEKYDQTAWEKEIRRAYGNAADAAIALEHKSGKNSTEGRLRRIDTIEKNWTEIKTMLDGMYDAQSFRDMMKDLGCPVEPKDIGITPELQKDTYLYSKDTRAVYTVAQLAWDLGVIDSLSDKIIKELINEGSF